MAGMENIYDILAKENEQSRQVGIDYSKIREGGVAAAVMAQAGGMLGGSVMQAAGFKTAAQKIQEGRDQLRQRHPNPTTYQDMVAMANDAKNLGLSGDWEQIMKRAEAMDKQSTARKVIKGADGFNYYQDTQERVLPGVVKAPDKEEAPLTIADRTMLNNFVETHGKLEGARMFADYKQSLAVTANKALSGEGGVKPKDISQMIDDWQAFSKSYVDSISQIDKMRDMADLSQEGNATAYMINNRELIKLVGDSQISQVEVNDMLHAGSLPERVASVFSMWIAGTPTDAKTEDIRAILDVIGPRLKKIVNEKRNRMKTAYAISGVPDSATSAVFGEDYSFKSNSVEEELRRRKVIK